MIARGCIVYVTYAPVTKLVHSSEIQRLILGIYLLTKVGYDFVIDCTKLL